MFLSLVSACIFWYITVYSPDKKRRKQLRPIIEHDIYSVNQKLFQIFNLIFSIHNQDKIHSGKLKKKDFYITLQNKCLNETYLYPKKISENYIVIGHSLAVIFEDTEELIDKILNLNKYASTDELILLEQIRKKLKTYRIDEKSVNNSAISKSGYPVVSNLGYMHQNMFKLYNLYQDIQKIIFMCSEYEYREILLHKVQYLYYSDDFKGCKKAIKKGRDKYNNTSSFLDSYDILCDYNLKKNNYQKIDKYFKKRYHNGSLVSSRSFVKVLKNDLIIEKIITKYYSDNEIKYCMDTIDKESKLNDKVLKVNIQIADYFDSLSPAPLYRE